MNMRKRKNAGRLLSRLLCLVTVMGMLVPMALADGASAEDSGIITEKTFLREISVVKHVQQTGTETPPATTFEFEVEDTARGE